MSDDGEGVRRDCHIQVQQQQLILTPIVSYALNAVVTPGWSVLEVRKNKEQEESESSVELLLMIQKLCH